MEDLIKTVLATGGGIGSVLLIYYVWRIEPRLRSMEITILQGQQVELLRLTRTASLSPELHENAMALLKNTGDKLDNLKKQKDV